MKKELIKDLKWLQKELLKSIIFLSFMWFLITFIEIFFIIAEYSEKTYTNALIIGFFIIWLLLEFFKPTYKIICKTLNN